MKSPGTVHIARKPFTMTGKILVAGYGVPLPPRIRETYAPILSDQRIDFTGAFERLIQAGH